MLFIQQIVQIDPVIYVKAEKNDPVKIKTHILTL